MLNLSTPVFFKKENKFMQQCFKILYFGELDSTNSYALKNISRLKDGQVIVASKQTNGRGRYCRKWVSNTKGNVYMSLVLKPSNKLDKSLPLANLTQYMCIVLSRLLDKYNVKSQIKWPNDVLVQGKKISGILSEISVQGELLKGIALGIGINLNMPKEDILSIDQPATSLNLILNREINREIFINELLEEFFAGYSRFLQQGFLSIKKEYEDRSFYIGKSIVIKSYKTKEQGKVKQVNNDGSLLIVNKNNEERVVMMGDLVCS